MDMKIIKVLETVIGSLIIVITTKDQTTVEGTRETPPVVTTNKAIITVTTTTTMTTTVEVTSHRTSCSRQANSRRAAQQVHFHNSLVTTLAHLKSMVCSVLMTVIISSSPSTSRGREARECDKEILKMTAKAMKWMVVACKEEGLIMLVG